MPVPPLSTVGHWQKARPVKPVRAHAKVRSWLVIITWPVFWMGFDFLNLIIFSLECLFCYASPAVGLSLIAGWFKPMVPSSYLYLLLYSLLLLLLHSPPTVWIFDECLTFSYHALFLCSSQGSLAALSPFDPTWPPARDWHCFRHDCQSFLFSLLPHVSLYHCSRVLKGYMI